ncbi:MAG: response regulator transcription factor [Bacteroidales bacterium]|nr:response regulator transcription factor [Bacteroidales bacterium]
MPDIIKVVIVDDHEIFRNGLETLLNRIENVKLSGIFTNGAEFLEQLPNTNADIVLMDIKMPVMDGIEATGKALKIKPGLKIVALSMFDDEEYLQDMLKEGAKGFLLKSITGKNLAYALSVVFSGNNYYSEELLAYFTRRYIKEIQPEKDENQITKREMEILQLVAQGLSNQEIADKLFISKRTVDGHKNNLIVKTGSKNIVDLLVYSIKNGLVKI